jgi:small subunit ribosomal protein S2
MFIGTKKQAQEPIAEQAGRVGMPYVNQRWLGGMLTNFSTVAKRLQRLKELDEIDFDDVAKSGMTKKELLVLRREKDKLEKTLGGIRDMSRVPSAVWIVDTKKEHLAVDEARKLGIPVVAILDTNCDPDEVDYKIPGNDDAIRSVTLLTRVVADAVAEGLMARSRGGDVKPESGTVAGDEPLAEWERELLAGQDSQPAVADQAPVAEPAAEAQPVEPAQDATIDDAALAGVGIETTGDEQIGALSEPIATDAVTPDGVPAGEAVEVDTAGISSCGTPPSRNCRTTTAARCGRITTCRTGGVSSSRRTGSPPSTASSPRCR